MKKINIFLLLFFPLIIQCESSDFILSKKKWVKGLWVSHSDDTLCFSSNLVSINKGSTYSFEFKDDSIKMRRIHSSNSNEYQSYNYEISRNEEQIILYNFLGNEENVFNKKEKQCELY